MTDTILPGIDGDLIDGPVGDDTLFGGADTEWSGWPEPDTIIFGGMRPDGFIPGWSEALPQYRGTSDLSPQVQPDTETVILDGRLWRIVRRVGGATVVDGATRRLIEVEEV